MTRSEIRLKWVGNSTRQLTAPSPSTAPPPPQKKGEPRVGRGLFGVHLLIPHFKFQFSISIKSSILVSFFDAQNVHNTAIHRIMR